MTEFGTRLRIIRKENHFSLLELSEKLGTSKSLLSRYENGHVYPSLDTAVDLAKFFHVSLDWLAGVIEIEADRDIINISDYENVFDKCIHMNIKPERLNTMIELLKG